MESVEIRDFALEHPASQRKVEPLDILEPEAWPTNNFWSTHVRITIGEAASRDHLALERTFLAYIRTASAFAQFGVTLAQLFRLNTSRKGTSTPKSLRIGSVLGATTEGVAIFMLFLSGAYFFKQQNGLMKGLIVGRGWELWMMLATGLMLFSIVLGLLVTVDSW